MGELPAAATRVLDEACEAGLALDALPGNAAKVRLALDLVRELPETGRLRVLDAGCGGRNFPLNVWEPLLPQRERLDVVGVDVAFLDETRRRAEGLGFPIEVRHGSILELERELGAATFDAAVSTQVLEHVEAWRDAVRQLAAVLRPGGLLLLTCDNGDLGRPAVERVRLAGKRGYAKAAGRLPWLARVAERAVSGEWEEAPTRDALAAAAVAAGLDVELCEPYALRDLKDAKGGPGSRLLALAFEEALREEQPASVDPTRYRILYLRARRPSA
jgi:SAM-dependent methyltransferase